MTPFINIVIDTPEGEQMDNLQNATLQGVGDTDFVCSMAVFPYFPEEAKTQEEIATYLKDCLATLSGLGWSFDIQIGKVEG